MNTQSNSNREADVSNLKIASRRQFLTAAAISPLATGWATAAWAEPAASGRNTNQSARDQSKLTVHEWGTFTALQDEHGRELAGVNVDDEPVPEFVHRLPPPKGHLPLLLSPRANYTKGLLRVPQYVMRMETPVLYFYPPAGAREPITLDVDVQFRGGWLSEFYPQAEATAPGLATGAPITPATIGTLSWKNVKVGVSQPGPETNEHVWLAPRKVGAAQVALPNGEAEKYLFYRGIGAFGAPLRVTTDLASSQLRVFSNFQRVLRSDQTARLRGAWLVHIRADGTAAIRDVGPLEATRDKTRLMASVRGEFNDDEFSAAGLDRLRESMHAALVADGLYADEAAAMLSTWEFSYFQSPGLRLFFTLPRAWTDHYLPLTLSRPANVERVMVGRIELVTAQQRAAIARIAAGPASSNEWMKQIPKSQNRNLFFAGKSFGDLGAPIPDDYQHYLALGRFRNALLAAEAERRPTEPLANFMGEYAVTRPARSMPVAADKQ